MTDHRGRPTTKTSKGRNVSKNSVSQQRRSKRKGLDGIFNRYGLNEKTAQAVIDGEHTPKGMKPNQVRNLQESLKTHGFVKSR